MTDETTELLMSQLADGELSSDEVNDLLLAVLDEPAGREKLKGMLRLRQATAAWRGRQPDRPVVIVADRPRAFSRNRVARRLGSLAAAACIGGLLVLAGVWSAGSTGFQPVYRVPTQVGNLRYPPAERVSPEQMQRVAKVFALHESVAGPLAWYAADDQTTRLASARGAEAGQTPIAVLLKLAPASPDGQPRTLVIVCRESEPAVIELPAESAGQAGLRVYLDPRASNGKVQMQYAIALAGEHGQPAQASLSGQRHVGLTETPLGQLALGEKVLNVEAAAWAIRTESKP